MLGPNGPSATDPLVPYDHVDQSLVKKLVRKSALLESGEASSYIPRNLHGKDVGDSASGDDDQGTATIRGGQLGPTDDNTIFTTRGSIQTTLTSLESDPEDFIDAGMANDNDLDHIVNAAAYYENLRLLRLCTAQICGIPYGIDNGPSSRDPSRNGGQVSCEKVLEGLCYLQMEGFCGESMSIIVADRNRPGVAVTVPVWLYEIRFLCPTPVWQGDEPRVHFDGSDFILRASSLQKRLGRFLGESVDLSQLTSPEDISFAQFVSKVLSVGLLSFIWFSFLSL